VTATTIPGVEERLESARAKISEIDGEAHWRARRRLAARLLIQRSRVVCGFKKPDEPYFHWASLVEDYEALVEVLDVIAARYRRFRGRVASMASGGMTFGPALQLRIGCNGIILQPEDKVPEPKVRSGSYDMEYASGNEMAFNERALEGLNGPSDRLVILADDAIRTAGTACAAVKLLQGAGLRVLEVVTLFRIGDEGQSALSQVNVPVFSLVETTRERMLELCGS